MRFTKKQIGFVGSFALILMTGCNAPPSPAPATGTEPQKIATPTSSKSERRDIVGYTLLPGAIYVPPEADAVAFATYSAPVTQVFAAVGKRVKKGEPLVQLSMPSVESSLQQATLALQANQAAYTEAAAKYQQPVRDAQRQLSQARAAERDARVNGDAAQEASARQGAEDAVTQALADAKGNMLPYAQQLDAAKEAYKEAKAGAKISTIKAPIGGTLLTLDAKVGGTVGANPKVPVAHVVDLDDLLIHATLTAEQQGSIKVGTPVVITLRSSPDKHFEGKVLSIRSVPVADKGGVAKTEFQATISFRNDDGLVKPDSGAILVGVRKGSVKQVITVPVDALSKDSTGKTIVKVLQGQDWKATVVDTGMSDGNFIEIKSGISEGDTVQVIPGSYHGE